MISTNGQPKLRSNPLIPDAISGNLSFNEFQQIQDLVSNVIQGRGQFFQQLFGYGPDGGRNIWSECRFPFSENLSAQFYRTVYDLDSIGRRVVELMPKECYQNSPQILEDESAKNETPFEEAFDELDKSLNPQGHSWLEDEKGSQFIAYCQRLEVLGGIGQFGVTLIGLDDGKNLQDPADGIIPILNNKPIFDSPPTKREIEEIKQMASNDGMAVNYDIWDGSKIEKHQRQHKLMHGFDSAEQYIENYHKGVNELIKNYCLETATLVTNQGTRVLARNTNKELMRCIVENFYKGGGAPPDGSFIMGTDTQYAWQSGLGMKMPEGASLSGTDQQYFGVQFGPSESFQPKPSKQKRRVLFLRCFDESLVQVVRYEWNIRNPRFGLPVMYRITLNDPRQPHSGVGLPLATVYVHWSRIHHFAKNLVVSEIFGTPEMKPVLKEILNIEKVKCGGAEGFWRACFVGLAFKTHPQLGGDVAIDKDKMDEMVNAYYAELNRTLTLMGMDVDTIAPDVADPTPNININMEAIAVCKGVPLRCLKGAERGELASSQDDEDWNERKAEYQFRTSTAKNIGPITDRFIQLGVLPEPDSFKVKWPDLDALSQKDKAQIAFQKTQATGAYVTTGMEAIVPPQEFFTKYLGFTEDEAENIVDAASKNQENPMTMPPEGELGHPATPQQPPKIMNPNGSEQDGDNQQGEGGDNQDQQGQDNEDKPPTQNIIYNGDFNIAEIQKIGRELANRKTKPLPMSGYGQIFLNEKTGDVWYVGGDGDDDGFYEVVKDRLMTVDGVEEVKYEAEGFPRRDGEYIQVYPKKRDWVTNSDLVEELIRDYFIQSKLIEGIPDVSYEQVKQTIEKYLTELTTNSNDYHDEHGRFASKDGSSSVESSDNIFNKASGKVKAIGKKIGEKFGKFKQRYGTAGAVAICAAMLTPLPGVGFATLGVAEGIRAIHKMVS